MRGQDPFPVAWLWALRAWSETTVAASWNLGGLAGKGQAKQVGTAQQAYECLRQLAELPGHRPLLLSRVWLKLGLLDSQPHLPCSLVTWVTSLEMPQSTWHTNVMSLYSSASPLMTKRRPAQIPSPVPPPARRPGFQHPHLHSFALVLSLALRTRFDT